MEGCIVVGELRGKRAPGRAGFSVAPARASVAGASVNLSHAVHALFFGAERLTPFQMKRVGGARFSADHQRLAGAFFASEE